MLDFHITVAADSSDLKKAVADLAEVARGKKVPKEVEDAFNRLKEAAKIVDDLVPDKPA